MSDNNLFTQTDFWSKMSEKVWLAMNKSFANKYSSPYLHFHIYFVYIFCIFVTREFDMHRLRSLLDSMTGKSLRLRILGERGWSSSLSQGQSGRSFWRSYKNLKNAINYVVWNSISVRIKPFVISYFQKPRYQGRGKGF